LSASDLVVEPDRVLEVALGVAHQTLELDLVLAEGEYHDLVLIISTEPFDGAPPQAEAAWRETEYAWRERVGDFGHTIAPLDAAHAYAVMRGLSSGDGGMVAAATTSLPERAEEGRNYDYRYVWMRDQCYAGAAAACAGAVELMDDSVRFVTARLSEHGKELRPAYTCRGTEIPDETPLDLDGYPGGTAVVGNRVSRQFQLDVFGEVLLLLAAAARHEHLDADGWRAAELAAGAILERWRETDAGIWELHPPARWTHSRLACAAGLRAISSHAPAHSHAARWLAAADAIVADTSKHALHSSGRWQRAPDDQRVDAALLLGGLRGAVAGDDPRSLATCAAVEGSWRTTSIATGTAPTSASSGRPRARSPSVASGWHSRSNSRAGLCTRRDGLNVIAPPADRPAASRRSSM
jgi:GH15 family glucan-1,4-alpha-glucosidase